MSDGVSLSPACGVCVSRQVQCTGACYTCGSRRAVDEWVSVAMVPAVPFRDRYFTNSVVGNYISIAGSGAVWLVSCRLLRLIEIKD